MNADATLCSCGCFADEHESLYLRGPNFLHQYGECLTCSDCRCFEPRTDEEEARNEGVAAA